MNSNNEMAILNSGLKARNSTAQGEALGGRGRNGEAGKGKSERMFNDEFSMREDDGVKYKEIVMNKYAVMTFMYSGWCDGEDGSHEKLIKIIADSGATGIEAFATSASC